MDTIKAISDIHGCDDELAELLRICAYNPDRDRLIFLGDYVDRGPKSRQVVERVREMVLEYGAVALGGNHEQMFLAWADDGDEHLKNIFLNDRADGKATVRSYCEGHGEYDYEDLGRAIIRREHAEHLAFLRGLPDYYEAGDYVFVHGGINPFVEDWKQTPPAEFRWIRDPFHRNPHPHAQTFVFGHTPTGGLHEDDACHDVWYGHKIIGIDGGCAYGHQLNCLEIAEGGLQVYSVKKRG